MFPSIKVTIYQFFYEEVRTKQGLMQWRDNLKTNCTLNDARNVLTSAVCIQRLPTIDLKLSSTHFAVNNLQVEFPNLCLEVQRYCFEANEPHT